MINMQNGNWLLKVGQTNAGSKLLVSAGGSLPSLPPLSTKGFQTFANITRIHAHICELFHNIEETYNRVYNIFSDPRNIVVCMKRIKLETLNIEEETFSSEKQSKHINIFDNENKMIRCLGIYQFDHSNRCVWCVFGGVHFIFSL